MPARTNAFQQIVRLIYEHLARDGEVLEESEMLRDADTGEMREVDVTLRRQIAGVTIVISIEATKRGRRADITWVESMLAKHRSLPTNKLLLVSDSGFSEGARTKAEAGGALPIEPNDMDVDDPGRVVASQLGEVKAKTLEIPVQRFKFAVFVRLPSGEVAQAVLPHDSILVVASDGTPLSSLQDEIKKRLGEEGEELVASLKVEDISESLDTEFKFIARGWEIELEHPDGTTAESEACLQYQAPGGRIENHPIDNLIVQGRVTFEVVRVSLTHMQLGPTAAASYGTAEIEGGAALLVITRDESGRRASLKKPNGTLINLIPDESLPDPHAADG